MTLSGLLTLGSAIKLNCDYKSVHSIVSSCEVSAIEVKSRDEKISGVSGTLPGVLNYGSIKTFKVVDSPKLEFIPSGIEDFFPNLEEFVVSETGLAAVHVDDLKKFPKLKRLDLSYNQLTALTSNLFEFNKNLEEIDLRGNNLTYIGSDLYINLPNLKQMDLTDNACINALAENSIELRKLADKISDSCQERKSMAFISFIGLCLLALLFAVILVSCIKAVINK